MFLRCALQQPPDVGPLMKRLKVPEAQVISIPQAPQVQRWRSAWRCQLECHLEGQGGVCCGICLCGRVGEFCVWCISNLDARRSLDSRSLSPGARVTRERSGAMGAPGAPTDVDGRGRGRVRSHSAHPPSLTPLLSSSVPNASADWHKRVTTWGAMDMAGQIPLPARLADALKELAGTDEVAGLLPPPEASQLRGEFAMAHANLCLALQSFRGSVFRLSNKCALSSETKNTLRDHLVMLSAAATSRTSRNDFIQFLDGVLMPEIATQPGPAVLRQQVKSQLLNGAHHVFQDLQAKPKGQATPSPPSLPGPPGLDPSGPGDAPVLPGRRQGSTVGGRQVDQVEAGPVLELYGKR